MPKNLILIAEDDDILGPMYKTVLENNGFRVVLVDNGESVFSVINKQTPDLIILDIDMPKKNGIEVLKELKQHKEWKHIHVIMLSNRSKEEDIRMCNELGANYAVKSNWPIDEMVEMVKSLF